jgi:hypothetical protein
MTNRAADAQDNVLNELAEIEEWSARMMPLPACHNNNDYMTIAVELMVRTTMLLTFVASLASDEATLRDGVTQRRAILLGLLVRMKSYVTPSSCMWWRSSANFVRSLIA